MTTTRCCNGSPISEDLLHYHDERAVRVFDAVISAFFCRADFSVQPLKYLGVNSVAARTADVEPFAGGDEQVAFSEVIGCMFGLDLLKCKRK
jgi:hypothetical protein